MDEEWSTSANEAIQITISQPSKGGPEQIYSFNPEYTEQFFGQDQSIFGYKDLDVKLRFTAHDVYPNLDITYSDKWKAVGDTRAVDLKKIFKEYLPPYAFNSPEDFDSRLRNAEKAGSFKPPGKCMSSYALEGHDYEIWAGELSDPSVAKLIERVQILIPFFIDGGVLIPMDDPEWSSARWRVWFIFEKLPTTEFIYSPYSLVGYSTAYGFLTYQPSTSSLFTSSSTHATAQASSPRSFSFPPPDPISLTSLPNRTRISQFLILPPFQGRGHGRHLYKAAISSILSDPACIEITVEDPNEHFDDLRDFCDYARLSANGTFSQIKLNVNLEPKLTVRRPRVCVPTSKLLDKPLLETLRTKNKLAPRQFARLVEMHLLSQIPQYTRQANTTRLTRKAWASDEGDRAFYYWRLLVKQRIYRQHKDLLIQIEGDERVEKLEQTLARQWEDYERLLGKMEQGPRDEEQGAESAGDNGPAQNESASRARSGRGKRKIVDDEDEESDEEQGAAKKPKISTDTTELNGGGGGKVERDDGAKEGGKEGSRVGR
ncbi:MAG: hypothetical protein LQ340_000047 [Diploschistes diacapsis]|nr:MAG: hypothetical protein LQ340_000047 [Diploschistes diacapsis]